MHRNEANSFCYTHVKFDRVVEMTSVVEALLWFVSRIAHHELEEAVYKRYIKDEPRRCAHSLSHYSYLQIL